MRGNHRQPAEACVSGLTKGRIRLAVARPVEELQPRARQLTPPAVWRPSVAEETFLGQVKRLIIGAPIPSQLAHRERFSRVTGLAILSSDPLSSVAYATEEILRVLMIGGIGAMALVTPIGAVIATMLAVVVFSYRQTIYAYPSGGGAYIVAKDNLGRLPSLIAAAALLIDYVLTVAVSIAAGVAAITSAFPEWHLNRVELSLGFVLMLMLGNLRGVRESGRIFAAPTYFFIASILSLIGVGAFRYLTGTLQPVPPATEPLQAFGVTLSTFMVLTAFSNGCTAMTGVEAVSNGVPAFRPPESRNAAATLVTMAVISITMFMGITLLAHAYDIVPSEVETVVSQIARATFGGRSWLYFCVQAGPMLILVLAANTAYADFPRLASIVARDRFLPRQFMNQGDRLAFSNGILILSVLAGSLLVVFGGDTHALIPLYMIGVFVSFTLSQAGMVIHWRSLRAPGWRTSAAINGFGATVTGVVLIVVAVTKAVEGAWIILVMMPILVGIFEITRRHYDHVASELTLRNWQPTEMGRHVVIVPIGGIQRAVVKALQYARSLSADVKAVYVELDPAATAALRKEWPQWGQTVDLVVLESPYRSLLEPLLDYIDEIQRASPGGWVTVILPEFLPKRLWQHLLHNQHALLIKGALLFKPNVVVTSVPFHIGLGGRETAVDVDAVPAVR
ncbi:MAG: APC family permease [Acidobacteria bacterium]|nr:APC family permease [Acidobacteriota bacterium]